VLRFNPTVGDIFNDLPSRAGSGVISRECQLPRAHRVIIFFILTCANAIFEICVISFIVYIYIYIYIYLIVYIYLYIYKVELIFIFFAQMATEYKLNFIYIYIR